VSDMTVASGKAAVADVADDGAMMIGAPRVREIDGSFPR